MYKIIKKIIVYATVLLFFVFLLSRGYTYSADEMEYGVTFSQKQATDLSLDWKKAYLEILSDLKVKKIRLVAYWDLIEKENGKYDWQDLDWQIKQAIEYNADIILAIGRRLPRWPECHEPDWSHELNEEEQEKKILAYLEANVKRYQSKRNIIAWQVENEPFLPYFGECPKLNKEFLDKEIALVKSLDNRPIVVTDSGELSLWIPAAKRADIFGTTMYLDTFSKQLNRYVHYPIKPGFFRFKKNLTRIFAQPDNWIVIEMQAEPWGEKAFWLLDRKEREKTMSLERFREIINFGQKTGFKEFYLWGVEFWYWEKEVNNYPDYWEEAKKLF